MARKKKTQEPTQEVNPQSRVQLVNTNAANGKVGETANPKECDVQLWLEKGWKRQ
jgi:hypothetical protein